MFVLLDNNYKLDNIDMDNIDMADTSRNDSQEVFEIGKYHNKYK